MQSDRFTKSSHERTLFDAWFGTVFAVLFASVFLISGDGSWLLRISPILLAVGFWLRYATTKRRPDVWEVVVDQHSFRYLRNGELVDEVRRTETVGIRCYTSWLSMEGVQSIKLDLTDGGVHSVSAFRLDPDNQNQFVNAVERQWDLTATNGNSIG